MPTNSPILPFLVLTMAGGCGVSNLMKRAGNNSWVCVQTGLEGGGKREGGDARGGEVESRHWCPCQNEGQRARERAALTATTSPKWLPVKAPEKKETLRAWITAVTPLWLTGVSSCEVPQRQAWLQSARASWNGQQGWALGLWGPPVCYRRIWRLNWGGGARVHDKCDTKSHWILNRLLISSCFHPSVLALSIWLGERIRTGLPEERMWAAVCLFAHKDERKAGLRMTKVWPPWLEKKLL